MNNQKMKKGMGWLPDLPDHRDYTVDRKDVAEKFKSLGQKSVHSMLQKVGVSKKARVSLPTGVNLSGWCSPIEDQETIGSCTANAGVGLIEYFERRSFGKHIDASRLFLYKVTRNLLHITGDTGAYLRTTIGAMTLFGVPPTEYWPYDVDKFDEEPSAFCYAFAQNYQAVQFYRLDPPGTDRKVLLNRIKKYLTAGLPSMFGFTVFSSIWDANTSGEIPYPSPWDRVEGGHAVVAIGFDDKIKIKGSSSDAKETKGAFLIRNSWGTDWGDDGYGWLPYDYILDWLAIDWWSLLRNEWIDTGQFQLNG
ncbi:MAG: C1 family peptidase [Promethearchaeota archaeon]|jgi:C1A family cysteine protease